MDEKRLKLVGQRFSGQKDDFDVFNQLLLKAEEKDLVVIDEIEELTGDDDVEYSIVGEKEKGKYRLDDKVTVIFFCEVMQRDLGGRMVPRFGQISRMFDIPASTVKLWWAEKDEILKRQSKLIDKISDYIRFQMCIEQIRILRALGNRDYNKESLKNLMTAFSILVNKTRLLSNLSTANISKRERKQIEFITPD